MTAPTRFEYCRDDVRNRVYVTVKQALSLEDCLAIVDRQVNEGIWSYSIVYDLYTNTGCLAGAEAQKMAHHVSKHVTRFGLRGPVVACARTVQLIETWRNYAIDVAKSGVRVEVFENLGDANHWLDEKHIRPPRR